MTDIELVAAVGGVLAPIAAAGIKFLVWLANLWAAIRREEITERSARAAADREASERRDDRQVAAMDRINTTINDHTTRDVAAWTDTSKSVARLEGKVDAALGIERTPVGDEIDPPMRAGQIDGRRKLRTVPQGLRAPKPGTHHDE